MRAVLIRGSKNPSRPADGWLDDQRRIVDFMGRHRRRDMYDRVHGFDSLVVRSCGADVGNDDAGDFAFVFREAVDDEVDLRLSAHTGG